MYRVVAVLAMVIALAIVVAGSTYVVKSTITDLLDLRGKGYVISFSISGYRTPFTLVFNNDSLAVEYVSYNVSVVSEVSVPGTGTFLEICGNSTHDIIGFYFNTSVHRIVDKISGDPDHVGEIWVVGGNGSVMIKEYEPGPGTYYYYVYVNGSQVWSYSGSRTNFSISLIDHRVYVWVDVNNTRFNYTLNPPYTLKFGYGESIIYPEITYHVHGYLYILNDEKIMLTDNILDIEYTSNTLYIDDTDVWSGSIEYLKASENITVVYAVLEDPVDTSTTVAANSTGIPVWLLFLGVFFVVLLAAVATGGRRMGGVSR